LLALEGVARHARRARSRRAASGGRRDGAAARDGGEARGPGRAIWKGAVTFGLVTIPVGLHAATERGNDISFRQLHRKDESPIDYKRFCEAEDVEVPWAEIVKGYEYARGRYVVITDGDLAKARVPSTQTFEIRDFVPAQSIDDLYFDHPYYLAPSGRPAQKPYALLRDALEKTGRVGVGTIVLRQREHLAALEPAGAALVLTTMRWAYEIRSPGRLDLPGRNAGWDRREMDLAVRLIETLSGDFDPARYRDTYHEVLLQIIEAKVKGEEVEVPHTARPPKVVDLMRALQQSLAERKPPTRAEGRRRPARSRRAA
jgi:DNA end-binding protein Ku